MQLQHGEVKKPSPLLHYSTSAKYYLLSKHGEETFQLLPSPVGWLPSRSRSSSWRSKELVCRASASSRISPTRHVGARPLARSVGR